MLALTNSARETTIWDVESGKKLGTNDGAGFPAVMDQVLVSPDASVLWTSGIYTGYSSMVQAWEVQSGTFLLALPGIGWYYVTELAISPDSTKIAGISRFGFTSEVEYAFLVWDATTGEPLSIATYKVDIDTFAFIPGQEQAIIASGGGFSLVDFRSGESEANFGSYNSAVIDLAVSADGKQLSAASANGVVTIYDLSRKAAMREIKVDVSLTMLPYRMTDKYNNWKKPIGAVAKPTKGGYFTVEYENIWKISFNGNKWTGPKNWISLFTVKPPTEPTGLNPTVRMDRYMGIGADPKGSFVAILKPDRKGIDLVDPVSLKVIRTIATSTLPLSTFSISRDGSMIAAVDQNNAIVLFDTASGSQINSITTGQVHVSKVAILPNNERVASAGVPGLYVWDIKSGKKVHSFNGLCAMAFSPNGETMLSDYGYYDERHLYKAANMLAYNTVTGKRLPIEPSADLYCDLSYTPDGNTVAIAGFERRSRSRNARTTSPFSMPRPIPCCR